MQSETFLDGRVTLICADVREALASLPDDHFDCVVTSPPYWSLRDYGVEGQLGMEPTLGEHIDVMVSVFREVRRVMKPSASLWLNYGDCYATSPNGRSAAATKAAGNDDRTFRDKPFSSVGPIYDPGHSKKRAGRSGNKGNGGADHGGRVVAGGYLKPKDLCMVPNRIAIALQEDGWWVRSEIIWGKTNPMPDSSGRYRPGTAHEKIWMLSKSAKCFYDAEAVAINRKSNENSNGFPGSHGDGVRRRSTVGNVRTDKQRGHSWRHAGFNDRWDAMSRDEQQANGRLLRNYEPPPMDVWEMGTHAFSESHFATFPPELAERCIKAGCPEGGHVLDPFGGSGTSALVALTLGRRATLVELSPEYAVMARARIEATFMGKDEGKRHMAKRLGKTMTAGPLFDGLA